MKLSRGARPTGSLFVQLITLTFLTLILAQAISLFLIFNLPPTPPDFYRLSEIEQTFRGQPPVFAERRSLELKSDDKAPSPEMQGRMVPHIRDAMAQDMGVPAANIVIASERGLLSDRRDRPDHSREDRRQGRASATRSIS